MPPRLIREKPPRRFPPKPPELKRDLAGQRVGYLTVLGYAGRRKGCCSWWCRCDCGNFTVTRANALAHAKILSCGCAHEPKRLAATITHGGSRDTGAPEYNCWHGIKQRCLNKNNRAFKNYGGRGITICDKWKNDFPAFLADVGPRPSPRHTIDRIDVNGSYEPGNVRWATPKQQSNNRRPLLGPARSWRPMTSAPKNGDLLLYMGVNVVAGGCYWHPFKKKWCDPDRPDQDIGPTWWATLPAMWKKE